MKTCIFLNQVSWIRTDKKQLLTVGDDRFVGDKRFQVSYKKDNDGEENTLRIRYLIT